MGAKAASIVDRLRDQLPVNAPYEGIVAEAYDAWISVDDVFADDAVHERVIARTSGPILELGCGTGRPMLRWLAAGHDVEGIDASADMLTILRRNAAARDLQPVLHHGDIAPLDLGRTYDAIVCPAGTFTLLDDHHRIRAGVTSYLEHLRPGGHLALTLARLDPTGRDSLRWRIRRTGTTAEATTVVVHEALLMEDGDHCQTVYNRIETFDPDGRLLDTWLRRLRVRSWTQEEARELLADVGFVGVEEFGDDDGWVTVARRPEQ